MYCTHLIVAVLQSDSVKIVYKEKFLMEDQKNIGEGMGSFRNGRMGRNHNM